MKNISEKAVLAKIKRVWDHDIKFVDGRFIEDVVLEFQQTKSEDLLQKIFNNYLIFRPTWARAFAPYCDNDLEAGAAMHDEIVWKSACKFDISKTQKEKGKAFNAYYVSACLNQLKNHRSTKMSHKNHPRIACPICKEEIYQIDAKHLTHRVDLERYRRTYPRYPLASTDGLVSCPMSGDQVAEITEASLNKANKTYTLGDFKREYQHLLPRFPLRCPITRTELSKLTSDYPSMIMDGYTEEQFVEDFPEFEGLIRCPFTQKKLLEVNQRYLDRTLGQKTQKERYAMAQFEKNFRNATTKAKQVDVLNPYTNKMVPEITPEMLAEAGTTIRKHLETNAEIWLNYDYPNPVTCPFTGRKMKKITKEHLDNMGKTIYDFYHAVCKYPLKRWQVKCAICGQYVDNIWSHLEEAKHTYAKSLLPEDFEREYPSCDTKAVISTNAFYVNESGDSIHVADLMPRTNDDLDPLEIEDSLLAVAENEMDKKLAKAVRNSKNLEDIYDFVSDKKTVSLPFPFEQSKARMLKENIRKFSNCNDFDVTKLPPMGSKKVEIMVPSKDTIKGKLLHLIEISDLAEAAGETHAV